MMMAFPALNGISLLMAPSTDKSAMARAMLPVIALNGWIAMAFIAALGVLVEVAGPAAGMWIWPLATAAFVAWLMIIAGLSNTTARVGNLLLCAFIVAAPFLIAIWWRCLAPDSLDRGMVASIADNRLWRLGLFAATLLLLLSISDVFGATHTILGRLGAFPLLPLYSLATIAQSGPTPTAGLEKLIAARPAILVGILLAMVFALVYARWLNTLRRRSMADVGWWLTASTGLIAGWLLTGSTILGLTVAMQWAETWLAPLSCL